MTETPPGPPQLTPPSGTVPAQPPAYGVQPPYGAPQAPLAYPAPASPDGAWIWSGAGWVPNPAYSAAAEPYRKPRFSALLTTVLLTIGSAAGIFVAVAAFHRRGLAASLLDGSFTGDLVSQSDAADHLVAAALIALVSAEFLTAIAFLTWLFITVRNNAALGGRQLVFSPAAAVAWWFCPIANYVQPVRAVNEAWKVSTPMNGMVSADLRRGMRMAPMIIAWWLCWLTAGIALVVTGQLGSRTNPTLDDLMSHDAVLTASGILSAAAAFLGALVVRTLSARQEAKAAALAQGSLRAW